MERGGEIPGEEEMDPDAIAFYQNDSDEEEDVFFDPDADPTMGRRVYELDGQMDEDEDDGAGIEAGAGGESAAGMAMRAGDQPIEEGDEMEGEGGEGEVVEVEDMCSWALVGHAEPVYAVAVHPTNPDLIATASGDDTAGVWSRSQGKMVAQLVGHADTVVDLAYSASGMYLATAGMDGAVRVWNANDGSAVCALEGPSEDVIWVKWHSKGDVVLAGSSDMSVWMWGVPAGACMAVFSGHSGAVNCGMFTEDGRHVVTGGADKSVRVWSPKDGQCLVTLSDPKGAGTFHLETVTCLDTRGDLILTGSEDNTAVLSRLAFPEGEAPSARVVAQLRHHEDAVECVAFCRTDPFFATGSLDGRALIYDLAQQQAPRVTCGHDNGVTQMGWHPTMPWLLTSGVDRGVRAWDAKNGSLLVLWTGHTDMVMGLAFSHDGAYVVSASDDKTARVWDFPTQ